jgi:hypothetical protein
VRKKRIVLWILLIISPAVGINQICAEKPLFKLQLPKKTAVKLYFRLHGYEKPRKHGLHADHPLLTGVHLSLHRWMAEPKQGRYDWSAIEKAAEPFTKAGKQIMLKIVPYSKGMKTPDWIINKKIPMIRFFTKNKDALFPVVWDERNLKLYEAFIKALALKFDGDKRIDLIEIGVGSLGFIYAEHSKEGVAAFLKAGWTPEIWEKYTYRVMDLYKKYFHRTRLAVVFTGGLIRHLPWQECSDTGKRIALNAVKRTISIDFNSLDPVAEKWKKIGFSSIIEGLKSIKLPAGFALGFGDDWPLWVSEGSKRRETGPGSTGGRDDNALKKVLDTAFVEWDRLDRQCPVYFTLLEPVLTATNPNMQDKYENNVARILLDALKRGEKNNCIK